MQIEVKTQGEAFYPITKQVESLLEKKPFDSGILFLFILHTSAALAISEDYDPSAKQDLERFMNHLAPRDLPFIEHTLEGPDDSPSHMKSAILHQHLAIPIEKGNLVLGTWQGIFLAEFRDRPHTRKIFLKFIQDSS